MAPYSLNWGGMQRVFYYANFLSSNNYNVTVIASKNTAQSYHQNKKANFKTIHFSNNLSSIATVDNKQNILLKSRIKKSINLIKTILRPFVKKIDSVLYNEPSVGAGINSHNWIKKNHIKIINHIEQNNYEDIILSVPPFGILIPKFLKRIKENINGNLIIDYRDPWNCWNNNKGIPFIREKKVLKLSDKVITTNENHREKLMKDFNLSKNKISVIMNGYDEILWKQVEENWVDIPNSNKLIISYIGTISFKKNHFRNCTTFLDAFISCSQKNNILLRFIGVKLSNKERYLMKNKYPGVEFISKVTQAESFNYMMKSHVLMNLHTTNDDSSKYLIGGKLFDYYRSKKIIFSLNSSNSFEFEFINKNNLGYCVENNFEDIHIVLKKMYKEWNNQSSFFAVKRKITIDESYSRNIQNEKLLSIL